MKNRTHVRSCVMEHGVAVYAAVYAAVQCGNRNMPHPMLDCGLDDPRTGRKMTEVSSRNRWMSHDVTMCHMSDVKVRVSFFFFFQIAQEGCEGPMLQSFNTCHLGGKNPEFGP